MDAPLELQVKIGAGALDGYAVSSLGSDKVQAIRLSWHNITHSVKVNSGGNFLRAKTTTKTILTDLSGQCCSGELTAIMGPSGGGKTSLLNVLADRIRPVSGQVLINGKELPKGYRRLAAYVMQDDLLMGSLTPRELLMFAANLRLVHLTTKEREDRVSSLIHVLGLKSCENTKVGNAFIRGVSGGERKRVSVGYELITNPSLLFLDEPTSGLDSYSSLVLIETLQGLARQGRTVICTIHQPSSEIFAMFDKLVLLAKGKLMYSGAAAQAVEYFNSVGYPCPEYTNPSDFFMFMLHTEEPSDLKKIDDLGAEFKKKLALELPKEEENKQAAKEEEEAIVEVPSIRPNYFVELGYLTERAWLDATRNPVTVWGRICQTIIMAVVVGGIFIPLGNNQKALQGTTGSLFFVISGVVFDSLFAVLLSLPLERQLLVREMSTKMYRLSTYFYGKNIVEFFWGLIVPMVNSLILYWFIGYQNDGKHFVIFYITQVVIGWVGGALGFMLGAGVTDPEAAVGFGPLITLPLMTLAGLFANLSTIGWWLRWLSYFSLFRWGYEALVTNELTGKVFVCDADEFVGTPPVCPYTLGEQYAATLGFTFTWPWPPIFILIGIAVALRFIALIFLRIQTNRAIKWNK